MKKKLIVIILILVVILLILFVPIKVQYRDGGTVDYRAITYRIINWNKLKEDGTYYKSKDIIFFPNNFHSIEYYEPVELPNIYVSVINNEISGTGKAIMEEEIQSLTGTSHWSKQVDGKTINAIFDSIDPKNANYKEDITISNKELVNIKTNYKVSEVEIQNIDKNEDNKYEVQYNEETKNISFKDVENGTYVVIYKIENNKDYAYYSFKVIIHN